VGWRNPPIDFCQKPRHRISDVIGSLNGGQCVAGLGVACANKGLWGDSLRTVLWSCVAIFFHLRLFLYHQKSNTPLDLVACARKQYAAGLSRAHRKSNTPLDVAMYVLGRSKSEQFGSVFVGRLYASGFGG
jgi:hypothetical protein